MKRFLFILFAVVMVFSSASEAAGKCPYASRSRKKHSSVAAYKTENASQVKPEISVEVDEGTPKFIHKRKQFPCSNGINHGGGCTRVQFYAVMQGTKITTEGALKKIRLKIGLKNVEVELSSELKKGSCLFDVVLKHELTHLALHRKVLNRFAPEIAKAILSTAENFQAPITQQQFDKIAKVLNDYVNRMSKEDDKQNALMDTADAYIYQQKQCFQAGKVAEIR